MNASDRMNAVIDYIEMNLKSEIDLIKIANIMVTNIYMAQKLFTFIFGTTIADYTRKRRLSEAGVELRNPDSKVIDIALKYGYNSPEAFTRAFHRFHGFNPSEIDNNVLKIQPILSYDNDLDQIVEYKIVDFEETKVFGYKILCPFEEALCKAPLLWEDNNVKQFLKHRTNPIYGVLHYLGDEMVEYYVAHPQVDSLDYIILPKAKYAVFAVPAIPGKGKEQLHKLFELIGKSWVQNSNHLKLGNIEFEYYTDTEIKYYIKID